MAPTPETPDERDERDDPVGHPQRDVEEEAPGTWVADPEGDAPEPNEPG